MLLASYAITYYVNFSFVLTCYFGTAHIMLFGNNSNVLTVLVIQATRENMEMFQYDIWLNTESQNLIQRALTFTHTIHYWPLLTFTVANVHVCTMG